MKPTRRTMLLWCGVGLTCALVIGALYGPMRKAWACYWMHAGGTPAVGEVVEKLAGEDLLVRLRNGAYPGHSCIVSVAEHTWDESEPGRTFDLVYVAERPERCELQSTVQLSGVFLWSITAGVGFVLLLIVSLGAFMHRTLTAAGWPVRRMEVDSERVTCPVCEGKLQEGYLPLLSGIHWRGLGEPVGLPHALRGLPGTVGWSGRPLVHAFRCAACEVICFQYGKPQAPLPGFGGPGGPDFD